MIINKVPNPKGGNAGRASGLINYIAALAVNEHSHGAQQEKCVHFEAANFVSENLQTQIKEMTALASSNAKSKNPIDHWVLSWRSDEQPTIEQAREAVQIFMKHMKLQGHQVAWGLHEDTDNTHIHIALNRINPMSGKCVEINNRFGYAEAHKALAKIEHEQGWKPAAGAAFEVQNGKVVAKTKAKKEQDTKPIKPAIVDKELQTGEKSVLRICQERAAPLIKSAKSWAELHANLAAEGFQFERFGSGSKIHFGDVAVKASDVDRAASISALQKKLGPYQPPGEISNDHHHHTPATSRTATGAVVAAKKPHATAPRKQPRDGLRTLSECNLAHDKAGKIHPSQGVLLVDVGTDHRQIRGLRRNDRRDRAERNPGTEHSPGSSSGRSGGLRIIDAGGSRAAGQRVPEPLNPKQPGWTEYQAIRAERSAAKAAELLALRTQHDADKDKLFAAHKAERAELMDKSWRGKGDGKNMLSSVIAAKQAAEKIALREQHKEQRDALHAKYAPMPQYKSWQQQPRLLAPVATMTPSIPQPERLSTKLLALTHSQDKRGLAFLDKGQELFIDQGRNLAIINQEQQTTQQIAAALAVAQHKFGNTLEVTGPDEFKQRAIAAAVEHNLLVKFSDPSMEAQRVQMIEAKLQAERDAQRAQREQQQRAEQEAIKVQAQEQAAEALALDAAREAAEQEREETEPTPIQNNLPPAQPRAVQVQQQEQPEKQLDEENKQAPAQSEARYMADIHAQINSAKAAANRHSMLAHSTTVEADPDAPGSGTIVASNEQFVAVQQGQSVKLYKVQELNKQLKYDGTDATDGKFAPGNELTRKNGRDGIRTVLTEERDEMQTEAERDRRNDGHGVG